MVMIIFMAKNLFGNSKKNRLETTIWAIQLILLSAGFISTVLVFKTSVIPYSLDIVISTLPGLWVKLKSWLSPLCICIIINFIIVFIAVSSALHNPKVNEGHHNDDDYGGPRFQQPAEEINQNYFLCTTVVDSVRKQQNPPPSNIPEEEVSNSNQFASFNTTATKAMKKENFRENRAPDHIKHILVAEQPKNNHHHCQYDRQNDYSVDIENDDTMEGTWKAIIDAGKSPARKELKKMQTWNAPPQVAVVEKAELISKAAVSGPKEMRKSETFNDSVLGRQRGGLRRDVLMSQAELKRRVEAFIGKFNDDMRLQRQESEQRFLEMINR